MGAAYAMAGLTPADVNVAEVHDCFTVMGAIGTEVIGKAEFGARRALLGGRQGRARRRVRDQQLGRADREGPPDRRHRHRDGRLVAPGSCSASAPEELQVEAPRAAATFNIGGPICASVCTVLTPAS